MLFSSPSRGKETIHGFTLIELLVVVLIIGILSAVAVPQYKKAVLKSRTVEAMLALNALEKAQTVYRLEQGAYTNKLENLQIKTTVPILDNQPNYGKVKVNDSLFLEWVWNTQHRCIAHDSLAHRVCQSLGGNPFTHGQNTETTQYYEIP